MRKQRWRALCTAKEAKDIRPQAIWALTEKFSFLSADNLPSIIVADNGAIARRISAAAGTAASSPRYQFLKVAEQGEDVREASILALVDAVLEHLYLTMLAERDVQGSGGLKRAFQRLSLTVGPRLEPAPGCEDLAIDDPRPPGAFVLIDSDHPRGEKAC